MRKLFFYCSHIAILMLIILAAGCSHNGAMFGLFPARQAVMKAQYTDVPIQVDGKLEDEVWKTAKVYKMRFNPKRNKRYGWLKEHGKIRMAWDDKYFYLAASFQDSDVIATGQGDQLHLYRLGEVCELFLKPNEQSYYWELYAAPNGKKTSFFYTAHGAPDPLKSFENYTCGLVVAAETIGTLNDHTDTDKGWTAEMAMPLADLTANGAAFGPDSDWRILIARYNYTKTFKKIERSTCPKLSEKNFHLIEEYAILRLLK